MKHGVWIERTLTRLVEVEAKSAAEARRIVEAYGIVEAMNDMTERENHEHARIIRVTRPLITTRALENN